MALTVTVLKQERVGRSWEKQIKVVLDNVYTRGGYALVTPIGTPIACNVVGVDKGFSAAWDDTNNKLLVYRYLRGLNIHSNGESYKQSAATGSVARFIIQMSASVVEFGISYTASSSATIGTLGRFTMAVVTTAGTVTAKSSVVFEVSKAVGYKKTGTLTAFTVKPNYQLRIRRTRQGTSGKTGAAIPYIKTRPTPSGAEALASATLASVTVMLRAVFQQV